MNVHTKVSSYTMYFFSKQFILGTGMNRLFSLELGYRFQQGSLFPDLAPGSIWKPLLLLLLLSRFSRV